MQYDGSAGIDPATFVLTLAGELDVATAPEAVERGNDAIKQEGVQTIVVDLAAVTFLDSTAIRALVTLRSDAEVAGIDLRLRNVSDRARRILAITGLDQVFVIDGA